MKSLSIILVFLLIQVFLSCERREEIAITVIDKTSQSPLDSVFVDIKAGKNEKYNKNSSEGYTDSTGNYSTSMSIGCTGGCYDIFITYSKEGYKEISELNNYNGAVIELEK